MSGLSQAVRLPKKFRFSEGCDEVAVRQVGRHLILSPRFADWEDYWANSTRPDDDFASTVLELRALELPLVTNNTREFSRVPELVIDNWLQNEG